MRPIETEYRGTTFKSRLEARWAVFFDGIGWGWKDEPTTVPFEGETYTPDFWIEPFDLFAEVKPTDPTRLEILRMKAAADYSCGVLLLKGVPDFTDYWVISLENGKFDEFPVLLEEGGMQRSPMDAAISGFHFGPRYHAAIDAARRARFDGYDNDRRTINQKYS